MFKGIPAKGIQFPRLPKFFDMEFGPQKVVCLFGKWDHAPPPNRSLLGEDQELERRKSSLHHFIILPIFYFPSQDSWCGREGGCHFFLLVKRGGGGVSKNYVWCGGGGGVQKFCPLKEYPLPHENGLVKVMFINRTNFLFATKKIHVNSSL